MACTGYPAVECPCQPCAFNPPVRARPGRWPSQHPPASTPSPPALQALLAVPNLALPAEALFSSAPSLPGAPFLSSAAAGLSSGLLGPTATSGAVQEAAGNLLAALSSGAPLGLGAGQATPLRLGAGQLLTADSHLQLTPGGWCGLPTKPVSLSSVRAGFLVCQSAWIARQLLQPLPCAGP